MVPGADRVDADAAVGQRQRHHARQLVDAALAGVVAGDLGIAITPLTELMLTIAPPPRFGHRARDRLADQERALQVDVDHRVPVGLGDVEEVGRLEDAGVVDQRRRRGRRPQRRGERGVDLGLARDVAVHARARAPARELGGQRLRRGVVDVPQRDRGAVARRERRAQAAPMPCAAPVTTATLAGEIEVDGGSWSVPVRSSQIADALGVELEVERQQLVDARVAQRAAVRAQAAAGRSPRGRASAPRGGPAPRGAARASATISSSCASSSAARRGTSPTRP